MLADGDDASGSDDEGPGVNGWHALSGHPNGLVDGSIEGVKSYLSHSHNSLMVLRSLQDVLAFTHIRGIIEIQLSTCTALVR